MGTQAAGSPLLAIALEALFLLAFAALWVGLHRLRWKKTRWAVRIAFAARITVGSVVGWLTVKLLGRVLLLNAGWGQWFVAVFGAAAIEAIIALYARERSTVKPRTGWRLLALRIGLVVLVLLVLLQPVLTFEIDTRRERYIAVLLDDSASMQLTDPRTSASEKMQLARLFGLPFATKASRLEASPKELVSLRQELETQQGALQAVDTSDPQSTAAQLRRRRAQLVRLLDRARQTAEELQKELATLADGPLKNDAKLRPGLQSVRDRLDQLQSDFFNARRLIEAEPDSALVNSLEPLRLQWRRIVDGLREVESQTAPIVGQIDEAVIASLGIVENRELEKLHRETRAAVARTVLTRAAEGEPSLLDELGKNRAVRLYRFAARPKGTDLRSWQKARPGEDIATDDEPDVGLAKREWREATDLAAALALAQKEIPPDQLAGVLILSDGRHNYGAPAEPLARRLGQAEVPVCSVVIGATAPPRDAALTDASCPSAVFLDDRLTVNAHLRAIGMQGEEVNVKLLYDGQAVDEKTVKIDDADFRTLVPLGHVAKQPGIHAYEVVMETPAGDFVKENNRIERHVAVTDSRIKLLLVDEHPRWEFRYVRNLFTGRDKTVQMQHVLLEPDRLGGVPERPRLAASAARPYGEFEATSLPESPEDWLKFEVIILGDVPPSSLDATAVDTLERFVGKHGGSLVVIAGPNSMPHAYTGTKLAELLPATFKPSDRPLSEGPEPAFRLALSPEGGTHSIMRVRPNPTDNAATWNSLPPMDWRHPIDQIKPGATVLAYADPVDPESAAREEPSAETRRPETERMRLMKENPLILTQRYGAGNVLLLAFDRTWRLRYRVGDTYHHQFWSQVLRWATANKLSSGSAHVRLGTDRYRYQPDEPVIVRAQLLDEQDNPVADARVVARVFQGDRLVLKKTLTLVPGSRGIYQGDFGALAEPGKYRVELDGSAVSRLLGVDQVEKAQAELLVTSMERTSEMVEVSADWRLPSQLADLSGGKAVGPGDARSVLDVFTAGSKTVRERRNIPLWDSWPMLILILAVVSGEWILRKKAGLT